MKKPVRTIFAMAFGVMATREVWKVLNGPVIWSWGTASEIVVAGTEAVAVGGIAAAATWAIFHVCAKHAAIRRSSSKVLVREAMECEPVHQVKKYMPHCSNLLEPLEDIYVAEQAAHIDRVLASLPSFNKDILSPEEHPNVTRIAKGHDYSWRRAQGKYPQQ